MPSIAFQINNTCLQGYPIPKQRLQKKKSQVSFSLKGGKHGGKDSDEEKQDGFQGDKATLILDGMLCLDDELSESIHARLGRKVPVPKPGKGDLQPKETLPFSSRKEYERSEHTATTCSSRESVISKDTPGEVSKLGRRNCGAIERSDTLDEDRAAIEEISNLIKTMKRMERELSKRMVMLDRLEKDRVEESRQAHKLDKVSCDLMCQEYPVPKDIIYKPENDVFDIALDGSIFVEKAPITTESNPGLIEDYTETSIYQDEATLSSVEGTGEFENGLFDIMTSLEQYMVKSETDKPSLDIYFDPSGYR